MNWQDNATLIDSVVDAVEAKVAEVLGIDPDSIIEEQESDEVAETRGYVSAEASGGQPMGVCAFQIPLSFTIGFQVPDDGRKKRVQRLEWAMKIVQELTGNDALPGFKLLVPTDFAVSSGGDEPFGFLWGGLTLAGSVKIARG